MKTERHKLDSGTAEKHEDQAEQTWSVDHRDDNVITET